MVISSLILYSSTFSSVFSKIPARCTKVLGVCRKYSSQIILCSVCGFVNGPKMICDDYQKNGGSTTEFSNSIILSSNAGLGFLVSCVGKKIWGDIVFGFYLFFMEMLLCFLLSKLLLNQKNYDYTRLKNESSDAPKISFSSAFSRSVKSSALTVFYICAFVVFFSTLLSVITSFLKIPTTSSLYKILSVIFEFCQGSYQAIQFENLYLCGFLTGFCIGFGGLCVHFQTFSVCEGFPLEKHKFVIFKLLHGLFCGFFSFLYVWVKKPTPLKDVFYIRTEHSISPIFSIAILSILIITSIIFIFKKIFKNPIDFSLK